MPVECNTHSQMTATMHALFFVADAVPISIEFEQHWHRAALSLIPCLIPLPKFRWRQGSQNFVGAKAAQGSPHQRSKNSVGANASLSSLSSIGAEQFDAMDPI